MLAAAFVTDDIDRILEIGLSEIPERCRLAEAVRDTLDWCKAHPNDWEAVWDRVDEKYGHYHGVHTINNAAFVVLGLKFGAEDFGQGIALSVRCGSDTDCNGATVGSILGARIGASNLPEKWVGVLGDRLLSSVRDNNDNSINALSERTCKVVRRVLDYVEVEEKSEPGEPLSPEMTGNLPGVWRATLSYGDNVLTINPDLGGQIEMVAMDVTQPLRNVKVDGHQVKFSYNMPKGGGFEIEVDFEGAIDGDTLEGLCMTGGFEFGLTATRIS